METTYAVIVTLAFADASTRSFKFNGVDFETAFPAAVTKVQALNANMPTAFKQTFISATGAECTMISRLQSVETTEEVIYSAS